jgi:hypothetical protein
MAVRGRTIYYSASLRPLSILYDSLVWFRLSLLTIDCKHVSCVSTSFSIC